MGKDRGRRVSRDRVETGSRMSCDRVEIESRKSRDRVESRLEEKEGEVITYDGKLCGGGGGFT